MRGIIILYTIAGLLIAACMYQCGPAIDKQLDFQERAYSKERTVK